MNLDKFNLEPFEEHEDNCGYTLVQYCGDFAWIPSCMVEGLLEQHVATEDEPPIQIIMALSPDEPCPL